MRSFNGPLGPLSVTMAAALFVLAGSTPADAQGPDDDDRPTKEPAPIVTPVQRAAPLARYAAPTPSNGFTVLVDDAAAFARKLSGADQVAADIVATQAQLDAISSPSSRRSASAGRIQRDAERLATLATDLPASLSAEELDAALEVRALRAGLQARFDALTAQQNALSRAGATALPIATTPWTRPAQGRITQRFGPTSLRVEPARVVDGVYYAHYHDGLDIGAEMYSPVVAAAPGIVTFVGSLTDGAEVVFIAHAGGYVTEYGHLDNYVAPPNVAVGDIVSAGQVIGRVGMTGNTTGPHLHLEVWHDGALVDPLTLMSR